MRLRIFQLYVRGDDAWVDDFVAARDRQQLRRVLPDRRHRPLQPARTRHRQALRPRSRLRATGGDFQEGLDWRTVKLIKDKFKIPLVLKGIATAEDAKIALDHGVDWIYVSNHGGRQLDHGRGAMHVLPEIVDAVAGRAKIIVDGGVLPRHRHRQGDRDRAPISSASAACNAGRWRPPARPASCGCWSCWRTR